MDLCLHNFISYIHRLITFNQILYRHNKRKYIIAVVYATIQADMIVYSNSVCHDDCHMTWELEKLFYFFEILLYYNSNRKRRRKSKNLDNTSQKFKY